MKLLIFNDFQSRARDSIRHYVGRSVRLSLRPSVRRKLLRFLGVQSLKQIRFELLPLPNYYTAPAHPHATDAAVYTALFFPNFILFHLFSFSFPLYPLLYAPTEASRGPLICRAQGRCLLCLHGDPILPEHPYLLGLYTRSFHIMIDNIEWSFKSRGQKFPNSVHTCH